MISDFSWVFSELSKTPGISAISQEIVDFDSTVPSLVNVIFVLSIFTYQMWDMWMQKI